MEDYGNRDRRTGVIHLVDDPVIADSDAIVIEARELAATRRTWIICQRPDVRAQPFLYVVRKSSKLVQCRVGDLDGVSHVWLTPQLGLDFVPRYRAVGTHIQHGCLRLGAIEHVFQILDELSGKIAELLGEWTLRWIRLLQQMFYELLDFEEPLVPLVE